jgi:hypothetical protein
MLAPALCSPVDAPPDSGIFKFFKIAVQQERDDELPFLPAISAWQQFLGNLII